MVDVYIYICTHVNVYMYTCECIYVHMCMYICTHVYVYMYTCVCIYMYTCVGIVAFPSSFFVCFSLKLTGDIHSAGQPLRLHLLLLGLC